MRYEPLSREAVISVINGTGAADRVPVLLHFWVHPPHFGERQAEVEALLAEYPQDVQLVGLRMPAIFEAPEDDPSYRWVCFDAPQQSSAGIDSQVAITDWTQLDEVLADFPSPEYPNLLAWAPEADERYRLGHWWFCFFERHWSLRGMTNALTDYYTDPESVHRLFRALTDFYLRMMERAKAEGDLDGIFTSDDIGTQKGAFFSPALFREFYKPYYAELIAKAHELGMHFWLHTCGDVMEFLPDFVEIGLDVIHPIQKYTMDEAEVASRWGDKLTIWAGFDVQQAIPWGTVEDVRREARFLIDTYWRPEGRFMLTAGNAVHADCTTASLRALFEECFDYGADKARGK